jgi:predicted cytidylate kinase
MAIITIGGNLGAGKTTLAEKLAPALGYEELYVGAIFREMGAERGMTIEEFYAEIKNDPALERSVDDRQKKLMQEKDNLIIQGRIAWFFARQSPFKTINILLTVDPKIGAKRTAEKKENVGKSIEEVARATAQRTENERERYRLLYGIEDYFDPAHYDIALDTSRMTINEVSKEILAKIIERL